MHRLLVGDRVISEEMAAKISAANPDADLTWTPPVPSISHSLDAQLATREDLTGWIESAKTAMRLWLGTAGDALERSTDSDALLSSPEYRELVSALAGASTVAAGAIPSPATVGPAVELAECVAKLRALQVECDTRANLATLETRSADSLRLRTVHDTIREKLRKLTQRVTSVELLECAPWQEVTVSLCDALRAMPEEREMVAALISGGNVLMRDAANRLRLTRLLVFPITQFRNDPVGFARCVLGIDLWPGQIEFLEAIRDNRRTTCRSGNKCGKTTSLAIAALWYFATRTHAEVQIGNATIEQLGGQLWKEIRKLWSESGICLNCRREAVTQRPCPHSQVLDGKMHNSCHGESGGLRAADGRCIYGRVAADSAGLLGFSGGDGFMIIADEASELDHESFYALEFNASAVTAKFVMSGNPFLRDTPFYETFYGEISKYWKKVHLSCEEASKYSKQFEGLMSPEEIEMAAQLDPIRGKKSPVYQVRVSGDFPDWDAELALNEVDIEQAHVRWPSMGDEGPLTIAVDPGGERAGSDPYGFCARRGAKIVSLYEKNCSIQDSVFVEVKALVDTWARPEDYPIPIRFDASSRIGVEFETELMRLIRTLGSDKPLRAWRIMPGQNSPKPGFKMFRDWMIDNMVMLTIRAVGYAPNAKLDAQLRLLKSSQKVEDDKSTRVYIAKSLMRTRLNGASPNSVDVVSYVLANYELDYERTSQGQAERRTAQARQQQRPMTVHELTRQNEAMVERMRRGM
jgi:DNA-binding transcriptional regulator/RsmH inhibitor MraZ